MTRKLILFTTISIIMLFSACVTKTKNDMNTTKNEQEGYVWETGIIVTHSFENKGGIVFDDIQEYYFLSDGIEYFIKTSECTDSKHKIADLHGLYLKLNCKIKDGLWDTNDPNVQSRIGQYLIYKDVEIIDVPKYIVFSDGNNNSYKIEPLKITYDPVSPMQSSSGTYSGGEAKVKEFTDNSFYEVFGRAENLVQSTDIHSKHREMGTGFLKIVFNDSEMKANIISGDEMNSFIKLLETALE